MPSEPTDREALLKRADLNSDWPEGLEEDVVDGEAVTGLFTLIRDLSTALREEMEGAAVSGAGCRTHPEVMGRHCDACMDQARANLRRVAEDVARRYEGVVQKRDPAEVEITLNLEPIIAGLDAEAADED